MYNHQNAGLRRGRTQPGGRDFICPCGKSYLSYPALFTHIKQKHDGKAPGQIVKPTHGPVKRPPVIVPPPFQKPVDEDDSQAIISKFVQQYPSSSTSNDGESDLQDSFQEIIQKQKGKKISAIYNPQEDLNQISIQAALAQWCNQIQVRSPALFQHCFKFSIFLKRAIPDKSLDEKKVKTKQFVRYTNQICLSWIPDYIQEGICNFSSEQTKHMVKCLMDWLYAKKFTHHKIKPVE